MGLIVGSVCLLLVTRAALAANLLQEAFSWSTLNYSYTGENAWQEAIDSKSFIPENVYPIDVDVSADGRVFITTPPALRGIPATLSTIDAASGSATSPTLAPYPDWSWHQPGNCRGITSANRVQIDKCGRIWVPDNGRVETKLTNKKICPKKLMWFNLTDDALIDEYAFLEEALGPNTLMTTIAVDVINVTNFCENTFAYIADTYAFNLIVFDVKNRNSWVVKSNYFYPYPLAGSFNVAGKNFDLMDGIIGLALSPITSNGDRILYLHSLTSFRESSVCTSVLMNQTLIENEASSKYGLIDVSKGERPSQTASMAMDDDGILYFSYLSCNTLNCWNSGVKYKKNHLMELDRDNKTMQFVSGLKIIRNKLDDHEIWLLSSRYQHLLAGGFDPRETNFYILKAPVSEVLGHNKRCLPLKW